MRQNYRGEKLLLTVLLVVVALPILLGGCVGIKDKFVSSGARERLVPLSDQIGIDPRGNLLITCGLREVSLYEAEIDLKAFWQDSQIAALQDALEARGFKLVLGAMRLFSSEYMKLGFVPFRGEDEIVRAGIAFEEQSGQLSAVGLVQQAAGTLNIYPDGREELWTLLSAQAVRSLVEQLQRDEAFQAFERELAAQGKRINAAQSLGAQTADKGLLYLAVEEGSGLTLHPTVAYYRVELSAEGKSYRMRGVPRGLCPSSKDENKVLGSPDGALMRLVGVYEASSEDKLELQVVRPPKDPCLLGMGVLACLDMSRWLIQKQEEVNRRKLQMHNIVDQQEHYNIVYITKRQYLFDLLLGGFDDLTEEQIEQIYAELAPLYIGIIRLRQFDPQFAEALRILAALEPEQLTSWMIALAQALSEGRFDEEYERLLLQGFNQFEQLVISAYDLQNREEAKQRVRQLIQQIMESQDPPQVRTAAIIFVNMLVYLARYYRDLGISRGDIDKLLDPLDVKLIDTARKLWWNGMLMEVVPFALSIFKLSMHIITFLPPPSDPKDPIKQGEFNNYNQMYSLTFLLDFMRYGYVGPDQKARLEQGLGTLYTAVAMMRQPPTHPNAPIPNDPIGWLFLGFRISVDNWIGLMLWLEPARANLDGKGVIALIRGDHCSECEGKLSQIVKWINQALKELPEVTRWAQSYFNPKAGVLGIIVLTFTKPGAEGVTTIVAKLQNERGIGDSDEVIMALWFDKDGRVQFACISAGCKKLQETPEGREFIERLKQAFGRALAIAMAAYPGLSPEAAWWIAYGVCGGDPDCILHIAEQIAKELGGGGDARCQWRLEPSHSQPRLKALTPC